MDLYLSPGRAAQKRMAQSFALDAADGLLTEANLAADYAARLISILRGAGAGSLSIGALKDAIRDALGDCQGAVNRALDSEGLAADRHRIDLSEIEGA